MRQTRIATVGCILLGFAALARPSIGVSAQAGGPVASLGGRAVEEIDIRRAAEVLAGNRATGMTPAAWRRTLLDRCVDRELLSGEAERRRLGDDAAVKRRVAARRAQILRDELDQRVHLPALAPTAEDILRARAGKLYRRADLEIMVLPSTPAYAQEIADRLREGASFDSLARRSSVDPSAGRGGRAGMVLVRDTEARLRELIRMATPGQVLGPQTQGTLFTICRVRSFEELSDAEISRLILDERRSAFSHEFPSKLLARHGFAPDSAEVNAFLFAAAMEPVDSILASLGPDGLRAKRGARPALGILARVDGDSVTVADLGRAGLLRPGRDGRVRLGRDRDVVASVGSLLVTRLVEREARAAGLLGDAAILHRLRLAAEGEAARAMVERAVSGPADSAGLRTYFAAHGARYRRPPGVRFRAAAFATRESALAAVREWNGRELTESMLAAAGFTAAGGAAGSALAPRAWTEVTLFEGSSDPLWRHARALDRGQLSPVIELPHGFAVGQVAAREPERPYRLAEIAARVERDYRAHRENAWVETELARLRAKARVRVNASRLQAIKRDGAQPSERRGG